MGGAGNDGIAPQPATSVWPKSMVSPPSLRVPPNERVNRRGIDAGTFAVRTQKPTVKLAQGKRSHLI